VTGLQPRLFAGPADASAFRLHAWALAGLPVAGGARRAHPAYPPRKIVVLARTLTRRFRPLRQLRALLRATGLPVEWVDEQYGWSFEEQVRLFASAGVVVAAHGAALTNIMFAPAHAAVIELTPYLLHWPLYRRLADAAGLSYHRVAARALPRSVRREAGTGELLESADFQSLCEDPQRVSSLDASSLLACNGRSKNSDIFVDLELFAEALAAALDDIGCRPRQFARQDAELLLAAQRHSRAPRGGVAAGADGGDAGAGEEGLHGGWRRGLELARELGVASADGAGLADDVLLVRPYERSGARIVNVRARCAEEGDSFSDKSPW
jgi:hypothetical protein